MAGKILKNTLDTVLKVWLGWTIFEFALFAAFVTFSFFFLSKSWDLQTFLLKNAHACGVVIYPMIPLNNEEVSFHVSLKKIEF
jgi:hypothetical protein